MTSSVPHSPRSPIFIYGPPGSGKSSLGRALADRLDLPFIDLDEEIEAQAEKTIPEIFQKQGEAGFRSLERHVLGSFLAGQEQVISLGGGALLDDRLRQKVESAGPVVCLHAPDEILVERLQESTTDRPLVSEDIATRLPDLLSSRAQHYASFTTRLDASTGSLDMLVWKMQVLLGRFRLRAMESNKHEPYDVRVSRSCLDALGISLDAAGAPGIVVIVSDEHVASLYASRALDSLRESGFTPYLVTIPAGEAHKTISTIQYLWESFLSSGLDRGGTVVALGGGVVGDLAGFAAATYLRGVDWVCVPTSLLAMVDASLGGKTGADLPRGKNLVGAFHPPRMVLVDPETLATLPEVELRSGMAEVLKHGLIGDPDLFERCSRGWEAVSADWEWLVRRAMAVKIQIIEADPYERNRRAVLNLGHTLGHAVERASGYELRHGEAVAIGMLAAARLSEHIEVAERGLAGRVESTLRILGLPVGIPPGMDPDSILKFMAVDKKRSGGKIRFVLPVRVGEVLHGFELDDPASIMDGML